MIIFRVHHQILAKIIVRNRIFIKLGVRIEQGYQLVLKLAPIVDCSGPTEQYHTDY